MKMIPGEGRGKAGGKMVLILCLHTEKSAGLIGKSTDRFPEDTSQKKIFDICSIDFLFPSVCFELRPEGKFGVPTGTLYPRDSPGEVIGFF